MKQPHDLCFHDNSHSRSRSPETTPRHHNSGCSQHDGFFLFELYMYSSFQKYMYPKDINDKGSSSRMLLVEREHTVWNWSYISTQPKVSAEERLSLAPTRLSLTAIIHVQCATAYSGHKLGLFDHKWWVEVNFTTKEQTKRCISIFVNTFIDLGFAGGVARMRRIWRHWRLTSIQCGLYNHCEDSISASLYITHYIICIYVRKLRIFVLITNDLNCIACMCDSGCLMLDVGSRMPDVWPQMLVSIVSGSWDVWTW